MRAITDVELFVLPADDVRDADAALVPDGDAPARGRCSSACATARPSSANGERLLALGSLSAGLTHELNNPAAAAVRATAVLRDRVAGMRHKLALIADGRLDGRRLHELVELQEAAVKQAANAPKLSAMEASDAEDALGRLARRARRRRRPGTWRPTLVAGGVDVAWLDSIAGRGRAGRTWSRPCAGSPTRSTPSC